MENKVVYCFNLHQDKVNEYMSDVYFSDIYTMTEEKIKSELMIEQFNSDEVARISANGALGNIKYIFTAPTLDMAELVYEDIYKNFEEADLRKESHYGHFA